MVDVASEFEPHIAASSYDDENNSKVIMFVGETGSGKTTQINAFISYLLGADLKDEKRILVIDDRNMDVASSITQYITIYCIRPISELFEGKTYYIIDTPGFGDTAGMQRDEFVTQAMHVMFNTITRINAIVLVGKATLSRATPGLRALTTSIFHLFAKDIEGCLRTILSFSDAGQSPAKKVLERLGWLEYCDTVIEVNNYAFGIANAATSDKIQSLRHWWNISMQGQQQVHHNLQMMESVLTQQSANVTYQRQELKEKCDNLKKSLYRTAKDTSKIVKSLIIFRNFELMCYF